MFLRRVTCGLSRNVRLQSTVAEHSLKTGVVGLNKEKVAPLIGGAAVDGGRNEQRPLPINVEAVYHSPLRNSIKYGDLIADVQLRSYDNENLDFYSDFILRAGYYLGMSLTGPKPLPTRRERWTVIKSPFAQAKSKENFERHTHKRLIRVWDTDHEVLDTWLAYINKHSITGVGIKCNVFKRASLDLEKDEKSESSILSKLEKQPEDKIQNLDEIVGNKVLELLASEPFKKHLK